MVARLGKKTRNVAMLLCLTFIMNIALLCIDNKEAHAADTSLNLDVLSAILIEASTGTVLYEYNADEAMPPASMSKMMTEYLVMEDIKSGKIQWDGIVTTSKRAASAIGSGQMIAEDEKLSVEDMFSAMSIYSANDASIALAEYIAGTEDEYAKRANQKAKELGLTKSHFINATGLSRADMKEYAPADIDGETMMSARDTAALARAIISNHKEILKFTSTPVKKLREKDQAPMINWNWMLAGNKDNPATPSFKPYAYEGLDGLKTGHTDEAGWCFTGTAERNGLRLISVIMGAKTEKKRFDESRKLLDYGFNNFEFKTMLPANQVIDSLQSVPIKKGVELEVPVVTQTGVDFVVKKGENAQVVTEAKAVEADKLVAPIKKGDVLGTVTVKYGSAEKQVNLIAGQDVEKAGWFRLLMRGIKNFFSDLFAGIKNLF